jgi:hypothetical protein
MAFPRPCIECGKLTDSGNRCMFHKGIYDQMLDLKRRERKAKSGQYSGTYKARAKEVRDTAIACHLCGEGFRLHDPWQADHIIPGDPASPLLPAHRSCNASRGKKPL